MLLYLSVVGIELRHSLEVCIVLLDGMCDVRQVPCSALAIRISPLRFRAFPRAKSALARSGGAKPGVLRYTSR